MKAAEHRAAAEKLMEPKFERGVWADGSGSGHRKPNADEVARAQVHATLALVAELAEVNARSFAASVDVPADLIRPAVPR